MNKKKIAIVAAIVFAVLMIVLVSIPLLFKKTLLETTKSTINKNVNAKVEFGDFKLSLFRSFPKVRLELEQVVITGKDEFQTDTLLNAPFVRAKMSLLSLFSKSGMIIEEINLSKPRLNLIVGKTGKVNWDLNVEKAPEINKAEKENQPGNSFDLKLEKIEIRDAQMKYMDREIDMNLNFEGINIDIKGKMFGTLAELLAEGKADRFSIDYKNVNYLSNIALETKSFLKVDYDKIDITILENELLVNRLPLEVLGTIKMPSDSMFFDLDIKSKESGFENFLALVPPSYEKYLKNVKTSGTASISGMVKGLYFGEIYPEFSLKMIVENGNLKYADLPEEIKNIKADVLITKPEGVLDLMVLKIMEAHAEIRNNPVNLTLTLNKLVSDPNFDGSFIGKIDFDQLKDALPLDSVNISGIMDANLFVKGNYSSIENEQYNKIKSEGVVYLDNFMYDSPGLTQKILVSQGKLDFSPEFVNLSQFNMKVGQSDFNLYGKVSNYLNYMFNNGNLDGDLQLISSRVDFNELLRLQVAKEQAAGMKPKVSTATGETLAKGEMEYLAFDVPKNINFIFRSNIENAVYDRVQISNINGLITAKNGKLILNGLNMNMLDGELSVTGSYENTPQNQPVFDFGIDVLRFDIQMAYQSLTGIRKMLPVAGQSQGKLSTNLKMKGQLTPDLKLIPASIGGLGLFNTENLQIINSPTFDKIKGILKAEKLKNVAIDDFKANFVVENGNLLLKPFTTKVAGQETTMTGSLSAQNLLNMRLDFNVEREAFGPEIQGILSILPGNRNISTIPASVIITGPVGNPEVKMDLSEARKSITDEVKKSAKEDLQKLGSGLRKLFER